jgi:hypothetical protein
MNLLAEFSNDNQVRTTLDALQAAGAPSVHGSWLDTCAGLARSLKDCGIEVDELPAWPPAAAVMVVTAGRRVWLRRVGKDAARRTQKRIAAGRSFLLSINTDDLSGPKWHRLRVVAADEGAGGGRQ